MVYSDVTPDKAKAAAELNGKTVGYVDHACKECSKYKDEVVLGYINDLGYDNYLIMHNGVLKSVLFDSNNLDVKWKETRYALPEGTTVPSRVLDTLHTKYPDFTYTEVFVIENQCGISYLFTDGEWRVLS